MGKKNWSINVTTRNPSRLRDILRVLSELEGRQFDEGLQVEFIRRVVGRRLYRPTVDDDGLTEELNRVTDEPIEERTLDRIVGYIGDSDRQALRGRTWAGIFNTLGFATASESRGEVVITKAGRALLAEDADESEIFLRQLMKWQLANPSPTSRGFSDFNLVPFVATLHLLSRLKGLSRTEFDLFVPTLTDIKNLDSWVESVKLFRRNLSSQPNTRKKAEFTREFARRFVLKTYREELKAEIAGESSQNKSEIRKDFIRRKTSNLRDYGDTIIRYFTYTGIVSVHARGRRIGLSPSRTIEAERIMQTFDGASRVVPGRSKTEKLNNWYKYLGSISEPALPFDSADSLTKIAEGLIQGLKVLIAGKETDWPRIAEELTLVQARDLKKIGVADLKSMIRTLRDQKREIMATLEKERVKSVPEFSRIIETLRSIEEGDPDIPDASLWLEWYTCLALKSINDEEKIEPNYPVDENNMPRSVAVAGKPDIEAYYDEFVLVSEVTMNRGKDQWVQEGIPVPRHILDVIRREGYARNPRPTFGIFIAPSVHYDTRNMFFYFAQVGLEGGKATVIPFTLGQFIQVLETLLQVRKKAEITRGMLLELVRLLDSARDKCGNGGDWVKGFPSLFNAWQETILSEASSQ